MLSKLPKTYSPRRRKADVFEAELGGPKMQARRDEPLQEAAPMHNT